MKKQQLLNILLIIFTTMLLSINLFAQEKTREKIDQKLKDIKGDVTKIIIQTDDGDKVFEGDEAEYIFNRIKKHKKIMKFEKLSGKGKNIWFDDNDSVKVIEKIIDIDGEPSVYFFGDDDSIHELMIEELADGDSLRKEVQVEEKDGKLVVKVKTTEDGKEKTETFEGDDAKEKLKELKHVKISKAGDRNKFIIKKKMGNKIKWVDDDHVIILDGDSNPGNIKIKIDVEKEDGDLKVIVEEKEGDETKITEYTGEEAEEFLEKHGDENIFIERLDDDDMKIIISKGISHKDQAEVFTWIEKEDDELITKKIKYSEEEGEKILTITTTDENGEEKVDRFTGEEAETKLKEFKKDAGLDDHEKKEKKMIFRKK